MERYTTNRPTQLRFERCRRAKRHPVPAAKHSSIFLRACAKPEESASGPGGVDHQPTFELTDGLLTDLQYRPLLTHCSVNIDGIARVQIVGGSGDPFLCRLLEEFERLTGRAVLLNTSFTRRGNSGGR
jgi:hypothetical protein